MNYYIPLICLLHSCQKIVVYLVTETEPDVRGNASYLPQISKIDGKCAWVQELQVWFWRLCKYSYYWVYI